MNIFKVIRYGCDEDPDGTDGKDTVFLVRAEDHIMAGMMVDERLIDLSHNNVPVFSQCIYKIGNDISNDTNPQIIMGPSYEYAYNYGNYPTFNRDSKDEDWDSQEL